MMESYHNTLNRQKRLVFSGPVLIATAVGFISTFTSVAAAVAVAESEGKRISRQQNALRKTDKDNAIVNNLINNNISQALGKSIDSLRYYTTLAAQTTNNHQNAIRMRDQVEHLFSTEPVLQFGDPETERWYTTIEKFVKSGIPGFTSKEYKEATRLTAGVTSLTTSLIPLRKGSMECKTTLMTKTLLIPVIRPRSTSTLSNGRLTPNDNQTSVYTLISEDATISKATTLFGRHIKVIGRK